MCEAANVITKSEGAGVIFPFYCHLHLLSDL